MAPPANLPRITPIFNDFMPKWLRPWTCLFCAFWFQMSSVVYGGTITHAMGATCLMREDVMMIMLCGVVGLNLPFPLLFRMKFRFPDRSLIITAALIIGISNIVATMTQSVPLLCIMAFVSGFFKLVGTFECNSTVQLWITHKRDFQIFFPAIYTFVVGNMSLSPWLSMQLAYAYQDWHAMNWFIAGVMLCIVLYFYTCTHTFRIMNPPLPFLGIDYIGMLLWAAVMLEIIFIFNYGEFYNWWNGMPFRIAVVMLPITLFLTILRMNRVRHPYIAPGAWLYKRLIPLMGMFAIVELINSTPKVLQNALTGRVLHYGITQTDQLYLVEVLGTVVGMTFILYCVKILRIKYTRLLTLGAIMMVAYTSMLYLLVSPGLNIESLYIPVFCRAFGNAIFFTCLTIYIFDLMPFEHFFMCITMAGLIRNGVVETMCSGIYSFYLRHHLMLNLTRGLPYYDGTQALMISIKQLFGVTAVIATLVALTFLVWNIQPVRRNLHRLPRFSTVARLIRIRGDK